MLDSQLSGKKHHISGTRESNSVREQLAGRESPPLAEGVEISRAAAASVTRFSSPKT